MLRAVSFAISALLLLVVLGLVYEYATGRVPRAYEVVSEDSSIDIGVASLSPSQVAEQYRPTILLNRGLPTPPLLKTKYEVIDGGDTITVYYFSVWQDEVDPNPVLNALYWLYRAARYGYPVRDIEYLQVDVDAGSGNVTKVRFESSGTADYNDTTHNVAQYRRESSGTYPLELSDLSGRTIQSDSSAPLLFTGDHAQIAVGSWNHLSRAATTSDQTDADTLTSPLSSLTADEYADGKYARKSQGDYRTDEPTWVTIVGLVLAGIYAAGMAALGITRHRQRVRSSER